MQEPYIIVSLPKPLDVSRGRARAAPISSLSGSRKRKRHEVVVGVDGDSVNLYDVRQLPFTDRCAKILTAKQIQTQSPIASYPIPPQTYLTAKPCSVFFRGDQSTKPQRQTVLAVGDGRKTRKSKLLVFTEDKRSKAEKKLGAPPPSKRECVLKNHRVVGLDTVPFRDDPNRTATSTAIIVSYDNGSVDGISSNSLKPVWEHTSVEQEDATIEVCYSLTVDIETASQGILRDRGDVLAELGAFAADKSRTGATWLLCQVLRIDGKPSLRVSSLKCHIPSSEEAKPSAVHELFTCSIPVFANPYGRFELDAASGLLYRLYDGSLKVVDVSKIVPEVAFEMDQTETDNSFNMLQLTRHSVFLLSDHKVLIYESMYRTTVSTLSLASRNLRLEKRQNTSNGAGKRGRGYREIISSIPSLGLVVAIEGNNLVAFQLEQSTNDAQQTQTGEPHLLGAIKQRKRMLQTDSTEPSKLNEKRHRLQDPSLSHWKSEVDKHLNSKDIDGLENLIAKEFNLRTRPHETNGNANGGNLTNGHSASDQDLWRIVQTSQANDVDKIWYILSKAFRWTPQDDKSAPAQVRLEGMIKSRNIIRWLASKGLLLPDTLQSALSTSEISLGQTPVVEPGAIVKALGRLDTSLSMVKDVLTAATRLDKFDDLEGIKLLISYLTSLAQHGVSSDVDMDGENSIVNSHPVEDGQPNVLRDSEIQVRLKEMWPSLSRLTGLDQDILTRSMQSSMATEEILFLVGVLRMMLTGDGWTTPYIDDTAPTESSGFLNVDAIARLLSAAIDAQGLAGWIVGGSSNLDMTDHLITCLRAEVSAALEGCFEAKALDTILGELQRCDISLVDTNKRIQDADLKSEVASGLTVLPLGTTVKMPIVEDRSIWDGKRKQRQGTKHGRFVGKYSFERLRF